MEEVLTHKPVLLEECIQALNIRPDGIYLDGTLGRAGHSREIARRLTTGRLICVDRDQAALDAARERLAPYVDIWLADVKYVSPVLSREYSGAADYFAVCRQAVTRMLELAGAPVYDEAGILQRGVILRHLALPGCLEDSKAVLDWMAALPKGSFIPSLMSQYTPFYKAAEHKNLRRRISTWEYRQVIDRAVDLGLTEGYMQEKSSAREEYTPPFDLEGV